MINVSKSILHSKYAQKRIKWMSEIWVRYIGALYYASRVYFEGYWRLTNPKITFPKVLYLSEIDFKSITFTNAAIPKWTFNVNSWLKASQLNKKNCGY